MVEKVESEIGSQYKVQATIGQGWLILNEFSLKLADNDVVDLIRWSDVKLGLSKSEARAKISSSPELRNCFHRGLLKIVPVQTKERHEGLNSLTPSHKNPNDQYEKVRDMKFIPASEKIVNKTIDFSEKPLEKQHRAAPGQGIDFIPKSADLQDVSAIKNIQQDGLKTLSEEALSKMKLEDLNVIIRNYGADSSNVVFKFDEKLQKQVKVPVTKKQKVDKILELQEKVYHGSKGK